MKKVLDNRYQIIKILLIITICGQMGLHKLLAWCVPIFNLPYDHPLLDVAYILMEGIALLLCLIPFEGLVKFVKDHKLMSLELLILCLVIVITAFVSFTRVGLRITNILTHELDYIIAFWAIPIFVLLKNKAWSFEGFLKVSCITAFIGMAINIFGHFYFSFTGQHIYCLDAGKDWYDTVGSQRYNPVGFMLFLLPCVVYQFCRVKELKERLVWMAFVLVELWYMVFIYQSSTFILLTLATLFFCWFTESKKKLPFYIIAGIGVVGVVAILASGYVSNYIAVKRDDCLTSAFWHIHSAEYYLGEWAKHPFTGIGFFDENLVHRLDNLNLYIADAGILASWAIGGAMMVLLYLVVLIRGCVLGIKGCIVNDKIPYRLVFALTFYMLTMCFSAHWFSSIWRFGVPIVLALTEYLTTCED